MESLLKKSLACAAVGLVMSACAHRSSTKAEIEARYHQPFISPGTRFAKLPAAVQSAIRAQAGSAEIYQIRQAPGSAGLIYVIEFKNRAVYPPLRLAADGSLLNPDDTVALGAPADLAVASTGAAAGGLTLAELPGAALQTVRTQAPDAEIDTITKESHGGQVTYEVTFKGQRHAPLRLTADGKKAPPPAG